MLKMRRVWRRTSSSQADPSPWRHCWTSWASCSNVSSASKPATVQGVSASRSSLKGRPAVHLGLPTMERKLLSKCSPWNQGPTADRSVGHLTHPGGKTQAPEILGAENKSWENNYLACLEAFAFIGGWSTASQYTLHRT